MAHTNSTPNYNLPQFLGTDKPAWLTDVNNAMSDIDTAIAAAKTTADSADTAVGALSVTVGNHTTQLGTLSGAVTSQGNTLNTVTSLIGNGVPTTTDQTIIGAINELHANQGDLADLTTVDKSSIVNAINEVAQGGGGGISDYTYQGELQTAGTFTIPNDVVDVVAYYTPNKGGVGWTSGIYIKALGDISLLIGPANTSDPFATLGVSSNVLTFTSTGTNPALKIYTR